MAELALRLDALAESVARAGQRDSDTILLMMDATRAFQRGMMGISSIMSQMEEVPREEPRDFGKVFSDVKDELQCVPTLANLSLAPLECRRAFRKGEEAAALDTLEQLRSLCRESPYLSPIKHELVRVGEYMTRALESRFFAAFDEYLCAKEGTGAGSVSASSKEPEPSILPAESTGPAISSEGVSAPHSPTQTVDLKAKLDFLRATVSQLSRILPQLSVFSSLLSKIQAGDDREKEHFVEKLDVLFDCFRDEQGLLPPRLQLVFSLSHEAGSAP